MRNVILAGDVLNRLKDVSDGIVQTVVTSPPYYGLRDYGVEGQIGLEETPEKYISKMVEVFREVRRVLRDDGTLWLNIGDSYNGSGKGGNGDGTWNAGQGGSKQETNAGAIMGEVLTKNIEGLKPKDLIGIPWMLAFALRADGWYLRQEIIWEKPNPMPESVTDRCTKSHEHIFLLTKQPRYFYDKEAIAEPVSESFANDKRHETGSTTNNVKNGYEKGLAQNPKGPHRLFGKHKNNHEKGQKYQTMRRDRENGEFFLSTPTRNKRDVWTITTKPYSGAHFATFPPEIPEICIKAGSSQHGECSKCGKPWERVMEKEKSFGSGSGKSGNPISGKNGDQMQGSGDTGDVRKGPILATVTTGWSPQCECNAPIIPQIVLDPFGGSGTTSIVARRLGRDFITVELNQKYIDEHIKPRLEETNPLFGSVEVV